MTIELIRDLVVIIFGIIGTIFMILLVILLLSLYRQTKVIRRSISETVVRVPKLIDESRESLKGIAQILGMISAISAGIDLVRKIFEMNKGGKTNEQ